MPKTNVRTAPLSELVPDARNANRGTERGAGMLKDSLRSYGAGRSILLDKYGAIIAGNKTAEGAAQIGLEGVIIVESDGTQLVAVKRTDIDLDTPEGRALAIADNRVGEANLNWDAEALRSLQEEGVDLGKFWSDEELSALLASQDEPTGTTIADPDNIPASAPSRVSLGDLWQLGDHRLMCGDSTDGGGC